jgi:hypothetical protein
MNSHFSAEHQSSETESESEQTKRICLDCSWHDAAQNLSAFNGHSYCQHFTPEYWESMGYLRGWGDAAVMNWPGLEILIKSSKSRTEFLILAPFSQRRPVILYGEGDAWGMY